MDERRWLAVIVVLVPMFAIVPMSKYDRQCRTPQPLHLPLERDTTLDDSVLVVVDVVVVLDPGRRRRQFRAVESVFSKMKREVV
jgi:hypothetical protein